MPCGHESFFNYQDIDSATAKLSGIARPTLSECSQLRHKPNGHLESIDPYVRDLSNLVAESSYMAAPHLHHPCLKNTVVVHMVRHPVKVVNSFINYLCYFHEPSICVPPNPIYEAFIYRHLPELKKYSAPFERAAMYYVLWNEMIETREVIGRFRAEDGPLPLMSALGLDGKPFDDRTVNTYECPGQRFDVGMLPKGEVKDRFVEMGIRYGYRMSSEYLLM